MKADEELLKIITNEIKESIDEMEIVTPSIYSSLFSKLAYSHDTVIENEEQFTCDLLDEKLAIFTNMQNETTSNAQKLSDTTDKAINAIKLKDETILNEVLKETQNLRKEIEKLKESVYEDELTHVYNRKWLHDNLIDKDTKEFLIDGTVAIVDLNYFKIINDTYGHIIGDKVLQYISIELKKSKGKVIRYGGDEFLIIFPKKISKDTAIHELDKIRENILNKNVMVKEASFKVSFSIGISSFKKGDSLAEIVDLADKKMYNDKKEIKSRITGI